MIIILGGGGLERRGRNISLMLRWHHEEEEEERKFDGTVVVTRWVRRRRKEMPICVHAVRATSAKKGMRLAWNGTFFRGGMLDTQYRLEDGELEGEAINRRDFAQKLISGHLMTTRGKKAYRLSQKKSHSSTLYGTCCKSTA